MKRLILMLLLVGGCRAEESAEAPKQTATLAATKAGVSSTSVTGLFEGPEGQTRNQLCMVEGEGSARFGMVVWGGNLHSCSGTGTATRSDDTLTLAMAGDSTCSIEAKVEGDTITLPATLPEGCAYYCGARARMNDASFTRTGATREDALKAKDLVGDPLCAEAAED
jgi:hypothetical protein